MKKHLLFFTVFLLSIFAVIGQEAAEGKGNSTKSEGRSVIENDVPAFESSDSPENRAPTENTEIHGGKSKNFFSMADFVMEFSPALYFNPESSTVSAPSPVIYPLGIGFLFPDYTRLAIQPVLSFFTMYHLWYDGMALPAEIENRTSQTLCLLLNVPAVFSIFPNQKSRFQIYAGAAVLMRFGFLANGVKESDSGYTGSAKGDMDEINNWFWENARFFYLSFGGSWIYTFTEHLKAGPTVYAYIPIGSLLSGEGVQAMIISAGLKIML